MDRDKRQGPRGGRERTTAAILDAAEKLFSARGFTAVSVRDIAAEAGVSHALVHRYLGSKQDVYRATLVRSEDLIRDAASDQDELLTVTSLMLREGLRHQRRYVRLVAHSALHGLSYERTSGRFAATERLVELAEAAAASEGAARDPDALDPRFVVASVVALFIGWIATDDWVLRASGLKDMSDEEIVDSLERIVLQILRENFPAAGGGPPAE
jgi:TetR/AcrR family transcriptional regulator, repressor for neighboring sulfatase